MKTVVKITPYFHIEVNDILMSEFMEKLSTEKESSMACDKLYYKEVIKCIESRKWTVRAKSELINFLMYKAGFTFSDGITYIDYERN